MGKVIEMLKKYKTVFLTILMIILPILIEIILNQKITFQKDCIIRLVILYAMESLILIYKLINKFQLIIKKILEFTIKYRYIIAVAIFIIGVLCKINFSSIDSWCTRIGEKDTTSTIIGTNKDIRSDEWLTQTPTYLSQTQNEEEYNITNKDYMQGNGNLLMLLAPVKDITTISRPLVWGYLFFGQEYGFSWWWMLRMVLLFIVSFELARIITKKDNLLTLLGTLMLALAPAMMWWFSTAVVDSYIFGIGVVVLFHYYMKHLDWKIWKKLLIALGIIICLPSFAFALYPAYQVPIAFVMAIFMINDFIKHYKQLKKKDYLIMGGTILIILGLLARFIMISWDGIQTMMQTVYPGHRYEVGGDYTLSNFIKYFNNIFLPYVGLRFNSSEESTYIYPFIALIILIITYIGKLRFRKKEEKIEEKKKKENINKDDKFLKIGLIILFAILLVWMCIGFNETLAKVTFLTFSPSMRTQLVVGLIATILILILLKDMEKEKIVNKVQSIIISVVVTVFSYFLIQQSSEYKEFFTIVKLEIVLPMIFAMTYFLINLDKKKFAYVMSIIILVAGITINPIVLGINVLNNSEISNEIQNIEKEKPNQIWVGKSDIEGQFLLANGVNVLNGVHNYPNFEWLDIIDENREFNNIYNRYAHISVELGNNTDFNLIAQDHYIVELTYENIKDLNIKYYFSMEECSKEIIKEFNMISKYENMEKSQYIYQFNY